MQLREVILAVQRRLQNMNNVCNVLVRCINYIIFLLADNVRKYQIRLCAHKPLRTLKILLQSCDGTGRSEDLSTVRTHPNHVVQYAKVGFDEVQTVGVIGQVSLEKPRVRKFGDHVVGNSGASETVAQRHGLVGAVPDDGEHQLKIGEGSGVGNVIDGRQRLPRAEIYVSDSAANDSLNDSSVQHDVRRVASLRLNKAQVGRRIGGTEVVKCQQILQITIIVKIITKKTSTKTTTYCVIGITVVVAVCITTEEAKTSSKFMEHAIIEICNIQTYQ